MSTRRFLFITDNTSYNIGGTRYLGPYRVAHELEKIGIETFVIDRFYSVEDFFSLVEQLLNGTFIGVGISTTFFTPPIGPDEINRNTHRYKRSQLYYEHGVIDKDNSKRKSWFVQLKEVMAKKSPRACLFVGGAKASFFTHNKYLELDEIDYVVMGVVDMVFPQVIQDLAQGKTPVFKLIGNKKVIDTMTYYKQPKICPEHIWHPRWGVQYKESLSLEISRGCAFNCKFCNYDKRDSARKPLDILRSELIRNYENFGTQYYHFVDDCFNDHPKKVEDVYKVVLSLPFKIEWISYARFDVAVKYPETVDMMIESGCRGLHWGVESLTGDVARRAGKGTPPDKIKNFIMNFAKKYERICYSTGSFISGLPGETEETWNEQMDWLMTTQNFDFLQLGPLSISPYQGEFDGTVMDYSDYNKNPKKYGFLEVDFQRKYWRHETMDLIKAIELSEQAFIKWAKKMEKRSGLSSDIWIYPTLRSLGLSADEVYECYFNPDPLQQEQLLKKIRPNFFERKESYQNFLRTLPNL